MMGVVSTLLRSLCPNKEDDMNDRTKHAQLGVVVALLSFGATLNSSPLICCFR
jgi:hypothetical protein